MHNLYMHHEVTGGHGWSLLLNSLCDHDKEEFGSLPNTAAYHMGWLLRCARWLQSLNTLPIACRCWNTTTGSKALMDISHTINEMPLETGDSEKPGQDGNWAIQSLACPATAMGICTGKMERHEFHFLKRIKNWTISSPQLKTVQLPRSQMPLLIEANTTLEEKLPVQSMGHSLSKSTVSGLTHSLGREKCYFNNALDTQKVTQRGFHPDRWQKFSISALVL